MKPHFDDVLDLRLALVIEQLGDVADVDSLRSTAAGYQDVGLVPEVRGVAESSTFGNDLSVWVAEDEQQCLNTLLLNALGSVTSVSSTRTTYPSFDSFERSKLEIILRACARRTSSSRSRPWGS